MYKSILVPIDIAHRSSWERAIPQAIELAQMSGGEVTVITVVRDLTLMFEGVHFEFQAERLVAQARAKLFHILEDYRPIPIVLKAEVVFGNIRREILNCAKEHHADLIVMTSHRPEMKDYLIGPNTAHIAYHAPCSVLVLR